MTKNTLAFNHNPQGVLNPLTRNLYNMDHTCNHNFINLQFLFMLSHFYLAGQDCSASSPFDVLPLCYFHKDVTMTQCKARIEFFDFLSRLELYLWSQQIKLSDWLTNMRSKEGPKTEPDLKQK